MRDQFMKGMAKRNVVFKNYFSLISILKLNIDIKVKQNNKYI